MDSTAVLQSGHDGEWLNQVPRHDWWNCACWHGSAVAIRRPSWLFPPLGSPALVARLDELASERTSRSRQITQISGEGMSTLVGTGVAGPGYIGVLEADIEARRDRLASMRSRD